MSKVRQTDPHSLTDNEVKALADFFRSRVVAGELTRSLPVLRIALAFIAQDEKWRQS